jgi:hypothetical protein
MAKRKSAKARKRKARPQKRSDDGRPQTGWAPIGKVRFVRGSKQQVIGEGPPLTIEAVNEAARPKEPTYTREEVARMIDQAFLPSQPKNNG